MSTTIALRVRALRVRQGMTVKELAGRAGVSSSYIYSIEAGTRGSSAAKLARIANALGVSIVDLLPGGTAHVTAVCMPTEPPGSQ